jgi:DNA-binding transcriptional regulator YdaS (Cro superfamily)
MNLAQYLSQKRGRQAALCKLIGAHPPDVSKWASGKRPIPVPYGAPIESATKGLVTRQEMFPEEWKRFWPELMPLPKTRPTRKVSAASP